MKMMVWMKGMMPAVLCLVLLAPVAGAHGERVSTRPADGAIVTRVPDDVRINLTETPSEDASVVILDGCGVDVADEISSVRETLRVLVDGGQPGDWSVEYKVVSKEDGHKTGEKFSFSVEGQADCGEVDEQDPTAPDETIAPDTGPGTDDASGLAPDDSSLPVVPIALGSLALLGLALAIRTATSKT